MQNNTSIQSAALNKQEQVDYSVKTSAKDIFDMEKKNEFTVDIEAHFKWYIYYVDLLNYNNAHLFDPPFSTRHSIAYLGFASPSLSYIDTHRTREVGYYLHAINLNLKSEYLIRRIDHFSSDSVLLVHKGLNAAFYKLVSGKDTDDEDFVRYAKEIYELIIANEVSSQGVCAIHTVRGRYSVLLNAMALMVLELHDRFFNTNYSHIKPKILDFIRTKLQDKKTGLFYDYYQTGYLGFIGEIVKEENAWHTTGLSAATNGLALAFMHYFDKSGTEKAWNTYKKMFTDTLLSIDEQQIAHPERKSYLSHITPEGEALFGAMMAAKEMGDEEFFGILQDHVMNIGKPRLAEGKIFYPEFGELEYLIGHFILLARVHVGWEKLFSHHWEKNYDKDYNKVR